MYGDESTRKKGAQSLPTVSKTLVLPSDLPAEDFFSRVHAVMQVNPETAVLGWKESAELKRTPYHQLKTHEDLRAAFGLLVALQNSSRRKRPVIMEVANVVRAFCFGRFIS